MALEQLREAVNAIDGSYYNVTTPDKNVKPMERVFSYELYHQMRRTFAHHNLAVHGEFEKQLRLIPEINRSKKIIPDMVVHESHNIYNNLLAIEIKVSKKLRKKQFQDDIKKIFFYSRKSYNYEHIRGLGFQYSVLIVVNNNLSKNEDVRNYWRETNNIRSDISIWNIFQDDSGNKTLRFFVPRGDELHDRWPEWRAYGRL